MSTLHTLRIRTPEGIEFSLLLASPVTRMMALSVDIGVVLVGSKLLGIFAHFISWINRDLATGFYLLSYLSISLGYGMVMEWCWRGQTIGKRILRLRVMDERGLRLHFSQIMIRNLLRIIDMFPLFYLVGGIASLVNKKGQRLGDYAANTLVVRHPKIKEPDVEEVMAGKYNSFQAYPHLEARLRQQVSPQAAGLALAAIMRRDDFDPTSRVTLFRELAAYFREQVPFPEEASRELSAERYVRNVVHSLYRQHRLLDQQSDDDAGYDKSEKGQGFRSGNLRKQQIDSNRSVVHDQDHYR